MTEIINLIDKIHDETELTTRDDEAYQIFILVKRTKKIIGDIAEVGVYKGGTAKIICEAKENRILHLFDTFEGLPQVSEIDKPQFSEGEYAYPLEKVKKYLEKYSNVFFYKGVFPATAGLVNDKIFSFVHLDVDLYESTLNSLNFFYPRMNKGGIILSHNYSDALGVRKAFNDFITDKIEVIIELAGSQCLILKI